MFPSVCGLCVLLIFTISLISVFFVFHKKQEGRSLLGSNQQIYDFYKRIFLKNKNILNLCKVTFCISNLFIQWNTGSCGVYVTGDINICLYVCLYIGSPVSCLCFSICLYVWYQIFSKFDALLHKTQQVLLLLPSQGSTSLGP